jgi:hypothetical protein
MKLYDVAINVLAAVTVAVVACPTVPGTVPVPQMVFPVGSILYSA